MPVTDPSAVGSPDGGGFPGGYAAEGGGGGGEFAAPSSDVSAITLAGPTGPGWVIEIAGHHFYNDPKDRQNYGPQWVKKTLLQNLERGTLKVPMGPGQPMREFKMKEVGIGYAILALNPPLEKIYIRNPDYVDPTGAAQAGGGFGAPPPGVPPGAATPAAGTPAVDPDKKPSFEVQQYRFVVQFVWQEKPMKLRLEEIKKAEEAAAAAAKAAAEAAAANGTAPPAGASAAPPAPPVAPPAAAPPAGAPPATAPVTPPAEAAQNGPPPAPSPAPPAAAPPVAAPQAPAPMPTAPPAAAPAVSPVPAP